MSEIHLLGCRTRPLLSYLKALGVLRSVGAEADPHARLGWAPEGHARLVSVLDEDALVAFFLNDFVPTPITSPWNGGSGYYPNDNVVAIDAIATSDAARLTSFRATINTARELVALLPEPAVPTKGDEKYAFLQKWRAMAPDSAVDWLDAATVLTESAVKMNPLLGTGGNDGRLDFSNNYMQHLTVCLPSAVGNDAAAMVEHSRDLVVQALLNQGDVPVGKAKVGMFDPALSGLPNSWSISADATNASLLNPWDFVLMLEGAVLFAGGVGRRLSGPTALFPFTVTMGGVERAGGTMADEDARGETWLPIWRQPATLGSIRRLLAEGRAQDGRVQAGSGRAMGRAIATLGVDRGIDSFQRMVFAKRFGRNFVAVPADVSRVRASRAIELQRAADRWVRGARAVSGSAVIDSCRRLDLAAHAAVADEIGSFERWLLTLTDLELTIARLVAGGLDTKMGPLQGLPAGIVGEIGDSPEVRLALALSRVEAADREGFRVRAIRLVLEPLAGTHGRGVIWHGRSGTGSAGLRDPMGTLTHVAQIARPVFATGGALLADVTAFAEGALDAGRIVALAFAFSLCDSEEPVKLKDSQRRANGLDRVYAVTYLAARAGVAAAPGGSGKAIRKAEGIVPMLAAGLVTRAVEASLMRLRADALRPYPELRACHRTAADARRIAASLAFPLHPTQRCALEAAVFIPMHVTERVTQ